MSVERERDFSVTRQGQHLHNGHVSDADIISDDDVRAPLHHLHSLYDGPQQPNRATSGQLSRIETEAILRSVVAIDLPTFARILGVSRGAAYKAAKAGTIPCIAVAGRKLVPTSALARLLGMTLSASPTASRDDDVS